MAVLQKMTEPSQFIELKDGETVIGRLPECSVVLDPHGVSRKHALIRRDGDNFYLVDLESRNKTKLNEREIAPRVDHLLKAGDRINICDVEMIFYPAMPTVTPANPDPGVEVTEGGDDSAMHTLDASRSDLLACSVRPEAKLKAILEISRNLSSTLQLDVVAPKILDSLLDVFMQAERVFLVLVKEGEAKPTIRQTFHKNRPVKRTGVKVPLGRPSAEESRLTISRTIMTTVLNQKKAVLSQDAGNDANLPTSASIADLRIRSFMCAPLLTPDGRAMGILQLDTTDRRQFVQDDLDVLVAVASQAAFAIQNAAMHESLLARERIERDLRLAEQVQRRFLPQSLPKYPGFEFFAHYDPAFEVGGDFYDFVTMPDNKLAVVVGDVSGKGVSAALMMAKFSGDTRLSILTEYEPGAAANKLNETLCAAGIDEKFITLSLSVLDLSSGLLTFAVAGHFPMMVRRANGQIEEVGSEITGFPLGVDNDSTYQQMGVTLRPGDVAVIYSDGVPDAISPSGERYDSAQNRRFSRRVAASAGGAGALGRAVLQEIREFSAGVPYQADDITLVCLGPVAT
jgi:serine phosphatase RsbU (regulator of sigma subunit)